MTATREAMTQRPHTSSVVPTARRPRQRPSGSSPVADDASRSPHALAEVTILADDGTGGGSTPAEALDGLFDLAVDGPPAALPHRNLVEGRLGRSLRHVEAYVGPAATTVLDLLDAEAATRGHQVLLRTPAPDVATVAHEAVHALQSPEDGRAGATGVAPVDLDNAGVVEVDSDAEREADRVSARIAHDRSEAGRTPWGSGAAGTAHAGRIGQPGRGAVAGIALLRRGSRSGSTEEITLPSPPSVAPRGEPRRDDTAPRPQEGRQPAAAPSTGGPAAAGPAAAGPADGGEAALDPLLPAAPEPGITGEEVAERDAALAEAEQALSAATDVTALMTEFATAPPTVKARQAGEVGAHADDLTAREAQDYAEQVPDLHATLSGEVAPVAPVEVSAPAAGEVTLEATSPAPAPDPDLPETQDPGHFTANRDVTRQLGLRFARGERDEDAGARAEQIGESLGDVRTTDPDVPTSPGAPPQVPLEGESDPQRLSDMGTEGVEAGRTARDKARAAVIDGPGPEQAQPARLDEPHPVDGLATPTLGETAQPEGAQAFVEMGLPPEVETAFDQDQHAAMQASMANAVSHTEQAVTDRDEARDAAVQEAEAETAALSRGADEQQRGHVVAAREHIQDERRATLEAQAEAVREVEDGAEQRRLEDRARIDDRVSTDQDQIAERYDQAQDDIDTEIRNGEADASAKKAEAEREAEDQSWWDRAVNFVKQAFNALVEAIGAVFDLVRQAVNGILDAVKAVATRLIDAAAAFISGAIAAFGEFLKAAVNGLLGDVFPGLAAALTEAIDDAVAGAQRLVAEVAEGLKAGVNALVEGLRAGINAVLDTFQAAITTALAVMEAALTGDWSGLARKVLEAVLAVVGIDPEQFYAFVGRAEETFQLIVDDPGGFVGNLVEGVVGGVRRFAGNFVAHLQAGIIGWLTGALGSAGLTLPERFDLFGVLGLAQQLLGLTWERLRQKAIDLVGERNVDRLEYLAGWVDTLVTEGWAGVWTRIQDSLTSLRDQVLDGIRTFLLERVVFAAITRLATLFNPVGAIVQLVLAAWNVFTFLRDQLRRIYEVVQAVVDAVGDIARGILEPAHQKVEEVLGRLLPLALDFLARFLGLGNVGAHVREVVEGIRERIDQAIDRLIQRVLSAFRSGSDSDNAARGDADDPQARLRAAVFEGQRLVLAAGGDGEIHQGLERIRRQHELRLLDLVVERGTERGEVVHLHAEVNPTYDGDGFLIPGAPATEGGTVVIITDLASPQPRARFERVLEGPSRVGLSASNWVRAHLVGAGFGRESPHGIFYAPRELNGRIQNSNIELVIRGLYQDRLPGAEFELTATGEPHVGPPVPGLRLRRVHYQLDGRPSGGRWQSLFEAEASVTDSAASPSVSAAIREVNVESMFLVSDYENLRVGIERP